MNAHQFISDSLLKTSVTSILDLENCNLPLDYFTSVLPRAQYGDESAVSIGLEKADATLMFDKTSDTSKGVLFANNTYKGVDNLQKEAVPLTPSHGAYAILS